MKNYLLRTFYPGGPPPPPPPAFGFHNTLHHSFPAGPLLGHAILFYRGTIHSLHQLFIQIAQPCLLFTSGMYVPWTVKARGCVCVCLCVCVAVCVRSCTLDPFRNYLFRKESGSPDHACLPHLISLQRTISCRTDGVCQENAQGTAKIKPDVQASKNEGLEHIKAEGEEGEGVAWG